MKDGKFTDVHEKRPHRTGLQRRFSLRDGGGSQKQ
jgi:hypothetical protein